MRILTFGLVPVLVGVFAAGPVMAQGTSLDRPGLAVPRLRALCASYDAPRPLELQRKRDSLTRLLQDKDHSNDPVAWRAVGCVNGLLYAANPLVRSGNKANARAKTGWEAFSHFLGAATREPADTVAMVGLAIMALDIAASPDASDLALQIREVAEAGYRASNAGVQSPIVLRMCTEFMTAAGDFATARQCSHRALARGADSTWHLERRALLSFVMGDIELGRIWFEVAAMVAHDSAARDELAWRVHWVTDSSWNVPGRIVSAWSGLTDSARVIWMREHLRAAAPNPDESDYIGQLEQIFTTQAFQGALLQACPMDIIRNGAAIEADRSRCFSPLRVASGHIGLSGQLVRLWDPQNGMPIGLLAYALERKGLKTEGDFNARVVNATVALREYEWESSLWRDTTVRVALPMPNEMGGEPLAGVAVLPVFPGTVTWTVAARQGASIGAISTEGMLPLGANVPQISDLVLGVNEQGLSYLLHDDSIALAPQNIVKRKKPLQLYFQLQADKVMENLRINIVLRSIVRGQITPTPEVTMVAKFTAAPGINPVHRELNIEHIGGSNHQLEVQIVDPAGRVVAVRSVNLLVR